MNMIQDNGKWIREELIDNMESIRYFPLRVIIYGNLDGSGWIIREVCTKGFGTLFETLESLSKEDFITISVHGPVSDGGFSLIPTEEYQESVLMVAKQLQKVGVEPHIGVAIGIARHVGDRYAAQGETFGRGTVGAFFMTKWLRNMQWSEKDIRFVAAVVYGEQWGSTTPQNVKKEIEDIFAPYGRKDEIVQEVLRAIKVLC